MWCSSDGDSPVFDLAGCWLPGPLEPIQNDLSAIGKSLGYTVDEFYGTTSNQTADLHKDIDAYFHRSKGISPCMKRTALPVI